MRLDLKHELSIGYNLDLRPVFRDGLVIYAWSAADGLRIVDFVDPGAHFDAQSAGRRGGSVAIGKGANVDTALRRALVSYHRGYSHDAIYLRQDVAKSLRKDINKTTSRLDYWVLHHGGTMSATLDDDQLVSVHLEGRIQPQGPDINQLALYGIGRNLKTALDHAFATTIESTLLSGNEQPPHLPYRINL